MLSNNIINSFLGGASVVDLNRDVLVYLLDCVSIEAEKKLFLEFDSSKAAKSFYDYCFDYKDNLFLYYPTEDTLGSVPGFIPESVRYRKEALLSLHNPKFNNVCIGTRGSFNSKDIPRNTQSSISKLTFNVGQDVEMDYISSFLTRWGYDRVNTASQPGSYSKRGDVLDVFPPHLQNPIRVLFNFDKIEAITLYNPTSQRSIKTLNHIGISDIKKNEEVIDNIRLLDVFSSPLVVEVAVKKGLYSLRKNNNKLEIPFEELTYRNSTFKSRVSELRKYKENGFSFIIFGQNESESIFPDMSFDFSWRKENLNQGFVLTKSKVVCVSSRQFLNTKYNKTKWVSSYVERDKEIGFSDISNMKKGDFIVHRSFGVGVFLGLTVQQSNNKTKEILEIEYNNNSLVSVSIDRLNLIHKYVGSSNKPKINSLGSKRWGSELKKTRKAVSLVASELLSLYSKKENLRTFNYIKEDDLDGVLKDSFPFIETKDQGKAINDVFMDMNSKKPMDRLICGDVGFGKTEVALRSVFKAALSSKQSLFLCPTTILADQHYISCKERLGHLGVKISLLSRFKSKREQKLIVEEIKMNKVDVVIATHRALSKDVSFPNLGLLVIDEEHRFGVNHKEKIRAIKKNVDVLTLTATPIPRTLQQSLVGIRAVSLIQTPPKSRKPIETSVRYFDWEVAFSHINVELRRGGQVFFLQNDIKSIFLYQQKIQKRFSNFSVESLHGKMPPSEMEEKILSFFDGAIDVLVCTTIIESGLDIPNANCIIINDAQNFGLSQLYQIRGRVGRGERQARCLLFVPQLKLKNEASERLRTLEELTNLGSGYDISLKDLEIRGAGSLFGYKQSGHVSNVGFELYCEMLKDELSKVDKDIKTILKEPVITFYGDSYFDQDYIKDNSQRLFFYNKISKTSTIKNLKSVKEELFDRFGPIKGVAKNLFFLSEIRLLFSNTLVSKIEIMKDSLTFTLGDIDKEQDPLILINSLSCLEKDFSCQVRFKETVGELFVFTVSQTRNLKDVLRFVGRLFSSSEFV